MAEKMESLEERIPALERSHKQLQETLQDTLESSMKENRVCTCTCIMQYVTLHAVAPYRQLHCTLKSLF